jgi:hypothetical protein
MMTPRGFADNAGRAVFTTAPCFDIAMRRERTGGVPVAPYPLISLETARLTSVRSFAFDKIFRNANMADMQRSYQ